MQEQPHQISTYGFFQKAVYFVVILDLAILAFRGKGIIILSGLMEGFGRMPPFSTPLRVKIFTLFLIAIVAFGSKPKRDAEFSVVRHVGVPVIAGLALMVFSLLLLPFLKVPIFIINVLPHLGFFHILYGAFSLLGALLVQIGADNIARILHMHIGKDRFNQEEESYEQNTALKKSPTTLNFPYRFYFDKRLKVGWINLNPFRGTLVIGTPGSGKSYSVIAPAIRQFTEKGFAQIIYDFKYPDLSGVAYRAYVKKKKKDKDYPHRFQMVNLSDVRYSRRINPLNRSYVSTLGHAQEMAEAMVSSLQKGASVGGGSEQFFTQSAINFLSSCIYFFAHYEKGRYSTLPHVLAFLSKSYEDIFDTLFSNIELRALLSPFKSAYDNRAFDQLEGQVGTLRVFLSRLATKESFWVFSGDEVNLKVTDPKSPTILVLASSPQMQEMNSALFAGVLNRALRLINEKGNLPGAVVADEFPTIYIHKIDSVIATARSHKIAVLLGLQEIPQLRQHYKRDVADTICSIVGNVMAGSVRDKNTLDWLEKLFGKIKQRSKSESFSSQGSSFSMNERMDQMIPAGKIATLRAGEMVGIIASDYPRGEGKYESSAFSGTMDVKVSEKKLLEEENITLPMYYNFVDEFGVDKKDQILLVNYQNIITQVDWLIEDVRRSTSVKRPYQNPIIPEVNLNQG